MSTLHSSSLAFPDENSAAPAPSPLQLVKPDINANREEYYSRCCKFLLSMVGGQWIELSSLLGSPVMAVADKQPHFIEAVKRFIDEGRAWYHFGSLSFNDNYTKLYKCEVDMLMRAK